VIGKTKLGDDSNPQWRRMAWSTDGQMLAISNSRGFVALLDIMGGEFFTIRQVKKSYPHIDIMLILLPRLRIQCFRFLLFQCRLFFVDQK
jgi:hypothetical protein